MKIVDSVVKALSLLPDEEKATPRAPVRNVLSIAGSDASGGAGIQADLKTLTACGAYGCAVITAITAQNASRVSEVRVLDAELVARQIAAVMSGMTIHAVKIGMLGDADVVRAVAAALRRHRVRHVVVDPVIRSSSGTTLLADDAVDALRTELFPLASVVTPNASEAGALLDESPPDSVGDMRRMAKRLYRLGPRWVVITGGHVNGEQGKCIDVAFDGNRLYLMESPRVTGVDPHGAGCTYSSALAAILAQGYAPAQAFPIAQHYVGLAIGASGSLDARPGRRPLRHVHFDAYGEFETPAALAEDARE